jgi:hypothetical protein
MSNKCCKNCHFLSKVVYISDGRFSEPDYGEPWDDEDRNNDCDITSYYYSCKCFHSVWDTTKNPNLKNDLNKIITKKRNNYCFYFRYQKNMSFDAALKLQEQSKHRWTRIIPIGFLIGVLCRKVRNFREHGCNHWYIWFIAYKLILELIIKNISKPYKIRI